MRKTFILTLFMMFCSITFGQNAAKINETGNEYATLAKAISAATSGQTITFLRDINEKAVTVNKGITIDGANKKYTGQMSSTGITSPDVTVVVENVNFVNGGFQKTNQNSAGNFYFKKCNFDGYSPKGSYALKFVGANHIEIESCTVKNGQGLIYVTSSLVSNFIKDIEIVDCVYGVRMTSCGVTNLENFIATNVVRPVEIETSASRIVNITNGRFTVENHVSGAPGLAISTYAGTEMLTCNFYGENYINDSIQSNNECFVIDTDEDNILLQLCATEKENGEKELATLEAPSGLDVKTTVAGKCAVWEEGVYHHKDQMEGKDIVAKVATVDITDDEIWRYHTNLSEAVAEAKNNGKNVFVIANSLGEGFVIDYNLTIEFQRFQHKINKAVGSTGTETNGLQILAGNDVVLNHGILKSIDVAPENGKQVKMLVQNYANLTLNYMNLVDKTDHITYALSNNSGNVNIIGKTDITTDKVAFDVCKFASYKAPSVLVKTTGTIKGDIEVTEEIADSLHIQGGTFTVIKNTSLDDIQAWCDPGYFKFNSTSVANTCTVKGPYVAKVKETGVYYETLQAAIDAATDDQTVEIVANPRSEFVVTGAGAVINKNITIDLGGNAYVINKAVGSEGTETLGLQILAGNDVTLQNGTLTSTDVEEGKEVKMLVQNYANLTVKNINLVDNTEHILYVLSNNSGNVEIGEGTSIITDAVAFDVCKFMDYDAPVVTVAKNAGRIDGKIEVSPVIANNLTINGGIYSADYTDYCPDGLICERGAEVFNVVEANVAMIGGTEYETLAAAVEAATDDQTIELIRDVRNGYGVKIEKDLTIDFAGYTYQLKKGVGSTGTESNGLQILAGNTVALQNGALEVNPIFKYYFYILVQNYTDLTVTDMNLDGTNLDKWSETDGDSYVLSNNSGKVLVEGTTSIKANNNGDEAFAFDVCKYQSYEAPVVTITSTGMFDGYFEISEGLDENLHIQAGTYIKPVQDWCDPCYVSFKDDNEEGEKETWTVQGPFVAKVDDTENVSYYYSLAEAVAASQDKEDIVYLMCDAVGEGIVIDKDITIDFGGFTYTFNKTVGSAGTTTLGFQILKNNDVVLQNGTLKSTKVVEGKEVKMMVQNYANLTVNNMNLVDETEHILYVLSNNSGTVSIEGETNITTDAVAFDVCKYASYPEPVVTLETKGTISGAIEVSATLYIEKATLAENEYSYILMQENGELFHNGIKATIKKEYKATSEVEWATDNWNTISTPVKGSSVVVDAEILNTIEGNTNPNAGEHDLYWYDEATQYWRYVNGKVGESDDEEFVETDDDGQVVLNSGQGYLYTNNRNVRFSFKGELNKEAVVFPLSYTAGLRLAGFNLVGNPFTYNIGLENFKSEATLADGYYTITADGAWQARQEGAIITPMQSVLVKTDRAANLTINPKANNTRKASNASLEIVAYNDQYEDVAYVSFGEGLGLDKIEHRNSDIPMVFVPLNGKDYAIAAMSSDVKEIPVAFKANTMGQYTIEVNAKGCEFSEMYLVDRLTGEVTDLNSSDYTFIATAKDEANRFVIMFAEEAATSTTDNFAFINNGEIIIDNVEGNGVVRIYDMLGRPVSQYDVTESARISTSAFAGGLYIIQMVDGNGVKVQKVVID